MGLLAVATLLVVGVLGVVVYCALIAASWADDHLKELRHHRAASWRRFARPRAERGHTRCHATTGTTGATPEPSRVLLHARPVRRPRSPRV